MRLLTALHAGMPFAAVLAVSLLGATVAAHPEGPDHGLNNSSYYPLWAGDVDTNNLSAVDATSSGAVFRLLAAGTDIPLDEPPEAVERWNRGDLGDFPRTSPRTSVAPHGATLTNKGVIRDAYVEVFAVQPSTLAFVSPSHHPLYVARDGQVLATTDYRIHLPDTDRTGDRTVEWRVVSHEITETRLLVDGVVESTAPGSHTPVLPYRLSPPSASSPTRTLTVETNLSVTFEKRVRTRGPQCRMANRMTTTTITTTCWSTWRTDRSMPTETLTVRDQVTVRPYDISIAGSRARYPNGDLGLVVFRRQPWLGYSLDGTDVRGVWRFYAARDEAWETLTRRTASGATTFHSPLHPLQVYAYPFEVGPTAVPRDRVDLQRVYGGSTPPPTLPSTVELDTVSAPYTASYGIVTRHTTSASTDDLTAYGLVRGVEADGSTGTFVELQIARSTLTLTVENVTTRTVTVTVELREAATGVPIATATRAGYVLVQGTRVNTSADGTATTTIPRPVGGISARYEPGDWWTNTPAYTGDSDVVAVRDTELELLQWVFDAAIPLSVFLGAVFLIDRLTGWNTWPPWRGL